MSAFEFTPGGVKELDADATVGGITPINAGDAVKHLQAQVVQHDAAKAVATKPLAPSRVELPAPLKRRHFVKELKARLSVVERQIKNLRDLEEEAAEIKRLIAAAKAPPAKVRPITTARSAG